ncbi:methionyl-tRNA formyltransferase [Pantoea sp. Mhis]|uniref:methionyl-tRNA formyltransferase n=1 Tax=Pantoea sp. Mhis TaxID=2576759 RepID=UPI001357892F|nr:methionyl-tRNA formyltransferase [Pantoea sp. Mhis]MXP56573.1 methionyl-tRNA formyltransferase [Pantoea sp. Mhis]
MSVSLRIIFAGTPIFAANHLEALLLNSKYQVVGVITQPDRPAGRGHKIKLNPVKITAQKYNIPIFQPTSLKEVRIHKILASLQIDIMVVVAYGIILPKEVLCIPKLGCINIHGSLLPRWRGAAPIQRAICAGDTETGITVIQMDSNLDAGNILYQKICPITINDTTASMYNKLSLLGIECMLSTLDNLLNNKTVQLKVQNELSATYASKITKTEARLNWSCSAVELERCIRAFNPWPGSYFMINNQLLKVWKATVVPYSKLQNKIQPGIILDADKNGIKVGTNMDILNLITLQPPNKKIMSAEELLNSRCDWLTIGTVLT